MHPILTQRHRLGWYLAAWIPVALLLTVLVRLAAAAPWRLTLALIPPLCAIYAFQCLPVWYLCRSFPLRSSGRLRLAGVMSAAATVSASLWLFAGNGWALLLSRVPSFAEAARLFTLSYPLLFAAGVLLFFLAAAVSYLVVAAAESHEAEKKIFEMRILAQEAELKALKAQIDPHFLFNCLNSVVSLISSDPGNARRMCLLLSDFLRRSLQMAPAEVIPLSEELSLLEGYLDIERIRFGSRLKVSFEIDEESRSCPVPPLLLLPLIENAVNHGIARSVEGGEITVQARRHGRRLKVHIANPVDSGRKRPEREGIGLANVSGRLMALHGSDARLDTYEQEGMFHAEIRMPA